jgi:adenylate cyclase
MRPDAGSWVWCKLRCVTGATRSGPSAQQHEASRERGSRPVRTARLGLRTKWTLALVLVSAIPLAIASMTALRLQRRGLLDAERLLAVAAIDEVGSAIDQTLADTAGVAERLSRVLTSAGIPEEPRLALAKQIFEDAKQIETVAIYGQNGQLLDAFARGRDAKPHPSVVPQSFRPSNTLSDGGAEWLPTQVVGEQAWLRYATRMQAGGKTTGYLLAALGPTHVATLMANISTGRYGRSDRVVVTDDRANVIFTSGSTSPTPGSSLAGQDIFRTLSLPIAGGIGFAATTEYLAADGTPMVGTLRLLGNQGWVAAVRRPEQEAFATLAQTRRMLLLVGGALAALALVCGLWLGTRSTRPIRSLVTLVERYRRHDLEARSDVRTGDEVEVLGKALGDMAEGLAAGEKEIARRAGVETTLSRYLPVSVARSIASGDTTLALGGQRREVSILFADVVSFTRFAESAKPEQVVMFLNQLFAVLSEVVFRHGGMVDKFIGDCVMAVFGTPPQEEDHARRALATAEDIHRFTEAHAPAWKDQFGFSVSLAIGVATGEALVGNLGTELRMEYTAIGDVVNVAARLEALARNGQTLLTAETATAAGKSFSYRPLGPRELRGKSRPVEVLELL